MFVFLRYKNVVIAAVILVLSGFIARGMYSGYLQKKNQLYYQADDLEQRIEWVKKIEDTEKKLGQVEAKLIQGDVFYFNQMVQDIAQECDIIIESSRPAIVEQTPQYHKANVSLQIIGDYDSLVLFVRLLEDTGAIEIVELRRRGEMDDYHSNFNIKFTGLLSAKK